MTTDQKRNKLFFGWYIVGASFIITLYTGGIVHFGFTAIIEPMAEEFGWSYAKISLASSLRGFEMGLLAPVMGIFVDRLGPKKLLFIGGLTISAGFLLLSRVSSLTMLYVAFITIAMGTSTTTGTVLMTSVVNWFRRRVGLATGILASGFALGGVMVPVITRLIDNYGWRTAMDIIGIGVLFIVLPLSFLVRHKPEQYGLFPDGEKSRISEENKSHPGVPNPESKISPGQIVRNRIFWHIGLAAMCHSLIANAIVTHMMPYLSSVNISRSFSSMVALILPLMSIGGRLGSGWFIDRLGSKKVFAASFAFMTVGILLFSYIDSARMWLLLPFILIYAIGWGITVTTRITAIRECFGRARFGTITGFISGIMMVGNVTGAPIAGWVYDTWGSYRGAWLSFAAVALAGMIMVLTLPSSKPGKNI